MKEIFYFSLLESALSERAIALHGTSGVIKLQLKPAAMKVSSPLLIEAQIVAILTLQLEWLAVVHLMHLDLFAASYRVA